MISNIKKIKTSIIILFFAICLPFVVIAQGPPDPGDGNGGGGDPEAPIDGGLSLILAAGAAAGARKLYKNKKANSSNTASI